MFITIHPLIPAAKPNFNFYTTPLTESLPHTLLNSHSQHWNGYFSKEVCILNLNWKIQEKAALFALIFFFLAFLHFRAISSLMAQNWNYWQSDYQ